MQDEIPQLSGHQKVELNALVGQHKDVFQEHPELTYIIQHETPTPSGVNIWQQSEQVPEARRQAIEEQVQRMLQLGMIEASRSPWSSPVVMAPKQDWTLRFCNDFRKLNEVSSFDEYRMR